MSIGEWVNEHSIAKRNKDILIELLLLLIIVVFFLGSSRLASCGFGEFLIVALALRQITGRLNVADLNAANSDLQVANSLRIDLLIMWTRL